MSRFGTIDLLQKETANLSNEQTRHCRIGKVIRKKPPVDNYNWAADLLRFGPVLGVYPQKQ